MRGLCPLIEPLLPSPHNLVTRAADASVIPEGTMTTIRHQVRAHCAPDAVWALLSDLEAVRRYNPWVRSATIDGAQRTGVGARRSCELVPHGRIVEVVTDWEEGRALGLEVTDSDRPIHFMRSLTRIEVVEGSTRIAQHLEYRVKFGALGWIADRLLMSRRLASTQNAVLSILAEQAEALSRA